MHICPLTHTACDVHRDDNRALEFLHRHHKIPDGEDNHTHIFAMKKAIGHGLWIPELQSTLYHARMFEAGIDVRTEVTLQALSLIHISEPTRPY